VEASVGDTGGFPLQRHGYREVDSPHLLIYVHENRILLRI